VSDLSQKSDASVKSLKPSVSTSSVSLTAIKPSVSTSSKDALARGTSLDTNNSNGSVEILIVEAGAAGAAAEGSNAATPAGENSNKTNSSSLGGTDTAASTDQATAAVRDQDCTKLAQVAVKAARAIGGPELVGFVLLDPLCEAGEETGYVVSIQRMKRSAHAGGVRLGQLGVVGACMVVMHPTIGLVLLAAGFDM
jgi:hypothetical protein